jgi:hypothetical protein
VADKAWKQFEREAGALVGGKRYPANLGLKVDVEGPRFVGQCKLVKTLSLSALTDLAVQAEADGAERNKVGVVIVKHRRGTGKKTPTLVVMTEGEWRKL